MIKKTVLVITGTRAEWGLLRPVVEEMRRSRALEVQLLATGMHTLKKYGYTIDEIRRDGLRPDCVVSVKEDASMLEMLAAEIRGIEKYCLKNRPDLMLVLGDRDEPFAGAIVAGHLKIPVAHIHGGDATRYVVDDAIRHSITKFAHIHFPVSDMSAQRLRAMGEEAKRIHVTGSTAYDISLLRLQSRAALAQRYRLNPNLPWILFLQHPTPLDPVPLLQQIRPPLSAIRHVEAEKIIVYPNSDKGSEVFLRALEGERGKSLTIIIKSLPRAEYLSFMREAAVLVGNSSSGILEAGHFATPVVTIGDRQKGREYGRHVISVPYNEKTITSAIRKALTPAFKKQAQKTARPFGHGGASKKIVRMLEKLKLNDALLDKHIIV